MGKRYGRNQKRRHREALAKSNKESERLLAQKNTAQTEVAKLLAIIGDFYNSLESLNNNSAILPPKNASLGSEPTIRYHPKERVPLLALSSARQTVYSTSPSTVLYRLFVWAEENFETHARMVHMAAPGVPIDGNQACYQFSKESFRFNRGLHKSTIEGLSDMLYNEFIKKGWIEP